MSGPVFVPHSTSRPEHLVAPVALSVGAIDQQVPLNPKDAVETILAQGWPEVEAYGSTSHADVRADIALSIAQQEYPHLFDPVVAAAERIRPFVDETPLQFAPRLSIELGNGIYIKREDQQAINSFKGRGAANKLLGLNPEERERGVIAASAGNHAQGVARAAQFLGVEAMIVMPDQTPTVKQDAVARYGAKVILHGETYSDAYDHSRIVQQREGLSYVHPFDDEAVVEGQATVALEMLQARPDLTHVFIPIGGGGLAAGMARYLKTAKPGIKTYGVQYEKSDATAQSLALGERVKLDYVGKLADGVAVKEPGALTLELVEKYVDEVLVVSEAEIRLAMDDIYQETRAYPEAAGALGLAGIKHLIARDGIKDAVIGTVLSGTNISPEMIAYNSHEVEFLRGKRTSLYVGLPERPGALREFCRLVVNGHNILEFEHTYHDANDATIAITLSTKDPQDRKILHEALEAASYPFQDISDDEFLRQHAGYLNGGHSTYKGPTISFAVEFPERPGALLKFLDVMGDDFNIGGFHYKETGSDTSKVLITYQTDNATELQQRMKQTGYYFRHVDLGLLAGRVMLK